MAYLGRNAAVDIQVKTCPTCGEKTHNVQRPIIVLTDMLAGRVAWIDPDYLEPVIQELLLIWDLHHPGVPRPTTD